MEKGAIAHRKVEAALRPTHMWIKRFKYHRAATKPIAGITNWFMDQSAHKK
jgi:hypothetical protein